MAESSCEDDLVDLFVKKGESEREIFMELISWVGGGGDTFGGGDNCELGYPLIDRDEDVVEGVLDSTLGALGYEI